MARRQRDARASPLAIRVSGLPPLPVSGQLWSGRCPAYCCCWVVLLSFAFRASTCPLKSSSVTRCNSPRHTTCRQSTAGRSPPSSSGPGCTGFDEVLLCQLIKWSIVPAGRRRLHFVRVVCRRRATELIVVHASSAAPPSRPVDGLDALRLAAIVQVRLERRDAPRSRQPRVAIRADFVHSRRKIEVLEVPCVRTPRCSTWVCNPSGRTRARPRLIDRLSPSRVVVHVETDSFATRFHQAGRFPPGTCSPFLPTAYSFRNPPELAGASRCGGSSPANEIDLAFVLDEERPRRDASPSLAPIPARLDCLQVPVLREARRQRRNRPTSRNQSPGWCA